MSEVTKKLRRMLSQANGFAEDAPLESVARTRMAVREATAALSTAQGEEREEIESLAQLAKVRLEKYEAALAAWSAGVRTRAEVYHQHEVQRLQNPIASKV